MSESPTADWWCWTEDEPSTFRCRERWHDVRPSRPKVSAVADHLAESALHRAEQERDLARAELASARQELDAVRTARDRLDADLGAARAVIRGDLTLGLRRAWLSSGVTLASLGQSMGVKSPRAVAQLLDGSRDIRLSTLTRLADALGYDVVLAKRGQP